MSINLNEIRNTMPDVTTDPSLFEFTKNKNNKVTIVRYLGNEKRVVIPETLDGGTVKVLGVYSFGGKSELQEVFMPDCIETVRGMTFGDCANLKKVHLSERLTEIVKSTFDGCVALEEVNIPDNTKKLRSTTFRKAPLKKLHIGKSLQIIEEGAFYVGKEETISLPGKPTIHKILKGRDIRDITIDPENDHLKIVDSMILSADGKTLFVMLGGDDICTIPDGVETIKKGTFSKQVQLKEVVFPHSLKVIEDQAFRDTSIRSIVMPSGLRSIGKEAFLGCRELSSVTFNEGLETIGNSAFYDAPISIVNLPSSLKHLGLNSFILFHLLSIHLKFKQQINIDPLNPYLWTDGSAIYTRDEGGIYLSILYGSAFMEFYNSAFGDKYENHVYEVARGTIGIGESACSFCPGLLSIRLPDSVKFIGEYAFSNSGKLEKIRIPDGVEIIGKGAFKGSGIREIEIPASVKEIGPDAFDNITRVHWQSITEDSSNQESFAGDIEEYQSKKVQTEEVEAEIINAEEAVTEEPEAKAVNTETSNVPQIESGEKGGIVRSINELVGVIKGISFDGVINNEEVFRLQEWVDKNRSLAYDRSQTAMIKLVDMVLEDHIITAIERDQLLNYAEENLQSSASDIAKIYEFNGIIDGIICDGVVNEDEITQMKSWLDENGDLIKSYKPGEEVFEIIEDILADGIVTEEEKSTLLKHLESIIDNSRIKIKLNHLRRLVRDRKSIGIELITLLDNEMAISYIYKNAESQLRIALQSYMGTASADEEVIFISLCLIGMMGYDGNYYETVRTTFQDLYQDFSAQRIEGTIRTILNKFRSPTEQYINKSRIINMALFNSIVPAYFLPAFFEFVSDIYKLNFDYELPEDLNKEFEYVYDGLRDDMLTEGDDIQLSVTKKSYKLIQSTKKMILDDSRKWLDSVVKLSIIVVKLIDKSFWGKEIKVFNPYLKDGFEEWQKSLQKEERERSRRSGDSFRSNWEPRFQLIDNEVYLVIPPHRIPPQYNYYDVSVIVKKGDEVILADDEPDIREIIGGYRVAAKDVKLDDPLGELRYYVMAGDIVLYDSKSILYRDFIVFSEQGYELKNNTNYKGTAIVCAVAKDLPYQSYHEMPSYSLGAASVSYGDLFKINDQVFSFSSLIKMGIVGEKIPNQFVKPDNADLQIQVYSEIEYLVFETKRGTEKIEVNINGQPYRISDFHYECEEKPASSKFIVNLDITKSGVYTAIIYGLMDGKRLKIDTCRFAYDPEFSLEEEYVDDAHYLVSVKSGLCSRSIDKEIDVRSFSQDWLKFRYNGREYAYLLPLKLSLYRISDGIWHPLTDDLWIDDVEASSTLQLFGLNADEMMVYGDNGVELQEPIPLKDRDIYKEVPIEFLTSFKQTNDYTYMAFTKDNRIVGIMYCYNKCVIARESTEVFFDSNTRELVIEPCYHGKGNVVLEISRSDDGEVVFKGNHLESGEPFIVDGIESFVKYRLIFFEKPKGLVLQKNRKLWSFTSRFYAWDDLIGRDYRIKEVQYDQLVWGDFVRKTHYFPCTYVYLTERISGNVFEGEIIVKNRDGEFPLRRINPVDVEICSEIMDEEVEMSITKDGDGLLLDSKHHRILNTLDNDKAVDIFSYTVDMNGELI